LAKKSKEAKALLKLAEAFKNPFKKETERARLAKSLKVGTLIAGWEFYALSDIEFSSEKERKKTKLVTIFPPRQSWHTYSPEPSEMYALGVSGILLRQAEKYNHDWEIKWLNSPGRDYLDFEKNNFNEIYPTENFMDWNDHLALAAKIIQ